MRTSLHLIRVLGAVVALGVSTQAQAPVPNPTMPPGSAPAGSAAAALASTPDFVIGMEDVLTVFVRESKEISGDVVVRPDGKISLPNINEMQAAGLTVEQLRLNLTKAAAKFFNEEPNVSVTVKQINSRKVFLVGTGVAKPGAYPLLGPMTVMQLLAAEGPTEYADRNHIRVIRAEKGPNGEPISLELSFDDIISGKNLTKNVDLKPGDTVIVK